MKTINFSYNWNNKLGCEVFPTFRLSNAQKYVVGDMYKISLDGKMLKHAKLIDTKNYLLSQVTDYMAYLDSGYNAKEFKSLVYKMYKNSTVDLEKHPFEWLLLKTEHPVQASIKFDEDF